MKTVPFPVALLKPGVGHISFNEFGASLLIALPPFELPDHGMIDTQVMLDCISLPSPDPTDWANQRFEFPRNPLADPIEGSVYIGYHHHPIDVFEIAFGPFENGTIVARFRTCIAFSFEGLSASETEEYQDADWAFEIPLSLDPSPLLAKRRH